MLFDHVARAVEEDEVVAEGIQHQGCGDTEAADQRQHGNHALTLAAPAAPAGRSEEHTSELQSLMRISYAVFCLKKKYKEKDNNKQRPHHEQTKDDITST